MKRAVIASLFALALVFGPAPAHAETCQDCLDMLDVNEGVKCWKENGCADKITSNTGGGGDAQASFEELWRENQERLKDKVEAPTTPARPTVPDMPSMPEAPAVPTTPSVPGTRSMTPGR